MGDFFARSATYSYHLYLSADGSGKFWLSATDGEGPVLLRDALTPLPRYMLPEYRLNREETPVRASRLLVVRDTLLKAIERGDAPGLHLHMGDEVELAMSADPEGIELTFFLDGERSSLIGRLPDQANYLEPGWLGRFGDAGYELIDLPGFEEDDLDWIGRRIGADEWEELLTAAIPAMRERGLSVRSEIEYSPKPAGRIEIADCGEDYASVRVSAGESALRLEGLEGYVIQPVGASVRDGDAARAAEIVGMNERSPEDFAAASEEVRLVSGLPEAASPGAEEAAFFMRPAIDAEAASRLLGAAEGGTVRGEALAEFARLAEREWGALITGEGAAKFRDLHRLYDAADWSWSLRGGPVLERGAGVVRAEPVLTAGGRRFTAAELTDAWTQGRRYLRLEDGWIDLEAPAFARSLREHGAGGGSAGLISAGFSYRQRIGLPGESVAGELPLELEGPRPAEAGEERPALAHLRYLAGWGMNGGLHGGAESRLDEIAAWAAETIDASPDCRLLVVGRRELLIALAEASGLGAPASAISGADASESERKNPSARYEFETSEGLQNNPSAGFRGEAPERLRNDPPANASVEQPTRSTGSSESEGGLILVPVSLLQRADFEDRLQADILLLLEPDASVRSDETRLFSKLDGADARVRIAVYSDEGHMNDARVRAVQIRLLKLYDSLTRSFLLLDPARGTSSVGARPPLRDLPAPMPLPSWRKEGGMAELFVDEAVPQPQAPIRGGMAIPPRAGGSDSRLGNGASANKANGGWPTPDPRDTQIAKPQPERRAESELPAKRRPPTYGSEARPVRPVQQQSAEKEFVAAARANAERTEPEVPFVPFSSYWPTYAAMKPEQERWYFYWRSRFRAGEKIETDLSYLFIYVYELINGVGWEHPGEGLAAMIAVWESYRARFRRLDGYMADWVREFAMVNALDLPDSPALEQTAGQLKGELLDLELARRFERQPADLTSELIARLSDYDMTTSRFYKDAGKKAMLRVLPHIVASIDEHLTRARGIRLLGLFRQADDRITERYLFRSAVYDPEAYGRTFLVRAPKLGLHAPLRDFMTQLTRQTENELRARFKFGGRLRGIRLDAEIAEVIAAAVEREFVPPEQRVLPEPPKPPEVKFDLEELEKLRRDSEEVMRMLTAELMTSGTWGISSDGAGERSDTDTDKRSADRTAGQASAETSGEASGSNNEAAAEADRTADEERETDRPPQGDGQSASPPHRADTSAGNASGAGRTAAGTEEAAAEYDGFETMELPPDPEDGWPGEIVPGALSFEPEAADGSREAELRRDDAVASSNGTESKQHQSASSETAETAETSVLETSAAPAGDEWDTSELDEDWRELVRRLGPADRGMIRAVLLRSSGAEQMRIAASIGELPETMIDRINEIAMETIGDLLIDGGEVLDEYVPELERCIPPSL
ncbi:TerB N-terminal domain-containing protein [Saccharibacillus sp. O23]|uniref:TerB N-terminal domain-containing protein n=1 Tax=Saccharibacillus sp. O23 TaxID=2009338 RepID=UPI0015C68278|nr:TerB N-terminal domain-containing protein [Saccharibacillus sp. O23]